MDDFIEWRPSFEEMEFEFLESVPIGWSFHLDSHINPIIHFHPFARISLDIWFLRGSWLSSLNLIENLALLSLLYAMMRILDKEVFEAFKVPPKWFRFLLELHDVLPNESGLVN